MTTWRKEITDALTRNNEVWADITYVVFDVSRIRSDAEYSPFENQIPDSKNIDACLNYDFDSGFGATNGPDFTLWTARRVYFPASYDGSEWVESVPRHECAEATEHIGG